jgi:hypothetical protein|tara:strand:+ start:51 stop:1535 length:1485 start_codon:yes stop_codon:yes gene_type:complete
LNSPYDNISAPGYLPEYTDYDPLRGRPVLPLIDEDPVRNIFLDAATLLIPAASFLELNLIGRIFATELLLIGILPIMLLLRGRLLMRRLPLIILGMGLIWLFSQIVTDFAVESTFKDYARGWAKISFTLLNFMAIYLLIAGSRRRLVLFAAGLGIGIILLFIFDPPPFGLSQPWKFGLGFALVYLVGTALQQRTIAQMPFLAPALFLLIGAFFLSQGFRSGSGMAFMTAAYLFYSGAGPKYRFPSPAKILLLAAFAIMAVFAVLESYEAMVEAGLFGEQAQIILRQQSISQLGVLLGGRSEILIAGQAIMESPFLGHGSWAKSEYYSYLMALLKYGAKGGEIPFLANDLIPTHSVIFGAWVEAGLLGAVFWAMILVIVIRVMIRLFVSDDPLLPLIAFIGMMMIWDILFSPFGADRRFVLAYFITVMVLSHGTLYRSLDVDEWADEAAGWPDDEYGGGTPDDEYGGGTPDDEYGGGNIVDWQDRRQFPIDNRRY